MKIWCILLAGIVAVFTNCGTTSKRYDFTVGEDKLDAYVKVRLSQKEGEEVVTYWTGTAYAFVPQKKTERLFDFEGYNIAKAVKSEEGYDQLAREVLLFKNHTTGEIIESWYNPFLEDTVEVIHIWNDPANFHLPLRLFSNGQMPIHFIPLDDNRIAMFVDAWLIFSSPLPRKDFPEYSRSDLYQAGEIFNFFIRCKDLQNSRLHSIPVEFSWVRISDFLPWMRMGDREGYIIFSGRGHKLKGGFQALPIHIREYVLRKFPAFAKAPDTFTSPNMSSWRYFKKILQEREID